MDPDPPFHTSTQGPSLALPLWQVPTRNMVPTCKGPVRDSDPLGPRRQAHGGGHCQCHRAVLCFYPIPAPASRGQGRARSGFSRAHSTEGFSNRQRTAACPARTDPSPCRRARLYALAGGATLNSCSAARTSWLEMRCPHVIVAYFLEYGSSAFISSAISSHAGVLTTVPSASRSAAHSHGLAWRLGSGGGRPTDGQGSGQYAGGYRQGLKKPTCGWQLPGQDR